MSYSSLLDHITVDHITVDHIIDGSYRKFKSLTSDYTESWSTLEDRAGFRVAKCVAGAGVREGCKNVGKRRGFEEGPRG